MGKLVVHFADGEQLELDLPDEQVARLEAAAAAGVPVDALIEQILAGWMAEALKEWEP